MDYAVQLEDVSKTFRSMIKRVTLFRMLRMGFREKKLYKEIRALENIRLNIRRGEKVGIIGPNGSGKTTLLRLIGGIYKPTSGNIQVNGRVSSFLETGAGMDGDLTVDQNIHFFGSILGLSQKKIKEKYLEIMAFSELKDFKDSRLVDLSSGMRQRLVFAIAIQTEPDILILDETLSSSDRAFNEKCADYFKNFKKSGRSLLFSSHDENYLRKFTNRVIYLDHGRIAGESAGMAGV